jgi:hypothetical protein
MIIDVIACTARRMGGMRSDLASGQTSTVTPKAVILVCQIHRRATIKSRETYSSGLTTVSDSRLDW